MTMCLWIT